MPPRWIEPVFFGMAGLSTDLTILKDPHLLLLAVGLIATHAAIDPNGHAIALLTERDGEARPVLVLRPAGD